MKKKLISLLLCAAILLSTTVVALAADVGSLTNLVAVREYDGRFADVAPSQWFYDTVTHTYALGLLEGKSSAAFDPEGQLTVAEAITLAVRLNLAYYNENDAPAPQNGEAWYAPYERVAEERGILGATDLRFRDMDAAITRADFARIFALALPEEALTPVNRVEFGAIPDVAENYSYGAAVYALYRAGILTGSDSRGSFLPSLTITRAEAATITARMASGALRRDLTFLLPLNAEEIYAKSSPAVFHLEMFDEDELFIGSGSGFFISETGLAVTNCHVIADVVSAKILMMNGEIHDVTGIYDLALKTDCALIQISPEQSYEGPANESFPYLELGDSSSLITGSTIYTIGSPFGLNSTLTRGIISTSLRSINGQEFVQIDAPISPGSSGGALLNVYGQAIGITSAAFTGGQSLNLAMPINVLNALKRDTLHDLGSYSPAGLEYYEGFFPAPDFGVFANVDFVISKLEEGGISYYYRVDELQKPVEELEAEYIELLDLSMFIYYTSMEYQGREVDVYINPIYNVLVLPIGIVVEQGAEHYKIQLVHL
ncbi:MAG: trypsin-like peptidase domain-containing protein [Oscillospiraceae bacterium]|nr:trypsin-like peptidase domain-containing protein [Oscillospiraceae bacterium]